MDNPQHEFPTESAEQLDADVADILTRLYWQRRVDYQLEYYQERSREYEQHVDVAFRLGAILMTISSLLASLGVVMSNDEIIAPLISLLTAIIPAIVSYIAAFRQLYQWDRQLTLYRDTQMNLETAKLSIPDLGDFVKEDAPNHFPILVKAVEGVLQQEVAQWGQIARGQVEDDDDDAATSDFESTLQAFLTDKEGNVNDEQIVALREIFVASKSTPKAGQYNPSTEQLAQSMLLDNDLYEQQTRQIEEARQRRAELAKAASASSESSSLETENQPVLPISGDTSDSNELNISDDVSTVPLELNDDELEEADSDSDPKI